MKEVPFIISRSGGRRRCKTERDHVKAGNDSLGTGVPEDAAGISIANSAKPIWGDYNNDSYPDLYFGMGAQKLYRNNKNGTFTDVTAAILPPVTATEVTPAWIDYDKDNQQGSSSGKTEKDLSKPKQQQRKPQEQQ